jgi:anion-transporting  ArsA/GET3 family ATPase
MSPAGRAVVDALLTDHSVVVCCGSGGVGKTTVSAALGIAAARMGRRACVVTVDPARRLASALGVAGLANQPVALTGDWSGELWAVVLDPKGTFDDLVRTHAGGERQAQTILENRIYKNLTGALSGTQEYMAMEKLHQLTSSGSYDLVIVDTPPSRNAVDFLDAPARLTRFLGHRLFQLLLMPTRAYLRAVSVASQALLRTISKVAGSEMVDDAVAFFQAFEGMEEGFRRRAEEMQRTLAASTTAYVLVTAPRADTVAEALWFAERLDASSYQVDAVVANRVQPRFAPPGPPPPAPPGTALAVLVDNLERTEERRRLDEAALAPMADQLPGVPILAVPVLENDVHDLVALGAIAASLVTGSS